MSSLRDFSGHQRTLDQAAQEGALAAFMWKVYAWMSVGLALTGTVGLMVSRSEAALSLILGNSMVFYGLLIGELVMVIAFSRVAHKVSTGTATAMFLGYAFLNGLTFSVIFLAYTLGSIGQVFFITAGSFGALSFAGYTTKKDLSGMRGFLFIGLFGVIIASVVNIWLNSPAVYWISTYAGVLVFAGLTAYDTQKLKNIFQAGGEGGNLALQGALTLYLDFINLMLLLLRILGRRR